MSDADILSLARMAAGGDRLVDFLGAATTGWAGVRASGYWRCDEDENVPGLIYGVQLRGGYHAVMAHPFGVVSWGGLWPFFGVPCEAWHLEWDVPGP